MYISIVFLPFLAAILSGLFGRGLGVKGVYIINIICITITVILAILALLTSLLYNNFIVYKHLVLNVTF